MQVGDMILAVNMDCLLGSTYDEVKILLPSPFFLLIKKKKIVEEEI